MTEREPFEPTRDEERARKAIRSLPKVEADRAFRERLKADFVSGTPAEATPPEPARRVRPLWRVFVPLAAAAALIMAVFLNRGPSLVLSDIAGEGTVTVDGRAIPTERLDEIAKAVRPGARIELSEGVEMDLVFAQTLAMQFTSATATIPKAPARWVGRTGKCLLEQGELQILTGPGFEGGQLVIETPDGVIQVTGTLLSVVKGDFGTCVCIHRGTAQVGIGANDMEPIPAGKRKVMFADDRPPIITDVAPPHDEHLQEFDAKYKSGLLPIR